MTYARELVIGAIAGGTEGFDGVIDELKIYNRALTDVEIAQSPHRVGYKVMATGNHTMFGNDLLSCELNSALYHVPSQRSTPFFALLSSGRPYCSPREVSSCARCWWVFASCTLIAVRTANWSQTFSNTPCPTTCSMTFLCTASSTPFSSTAKTTPEFPTQSLAPE